MWHTIHKAPLNPPHDIMQLIWHLHKTLRRFYIFMRHTFTPHFQLPPSP